MTESPFVASHMVQLGVLHQVFFAATVELRKLACSDSAQTSFAVWSNRVSAVPPTGDMTGSCECLEHNSQVKTSEIIRDPIW